MSIRFKCRQAPVMLWRTLTGRTRRWLLRRRALRCKDAICRLAAAQRLGDQLILKQMALAEADAAIRSRAAALVDHPALLTAIALNSRDIGQGRAVVERIRHHILLRRVARSAREDAVRLAAARKLPDMHQLKQIAHTTADIDLRWQVACELNDPDLLAEVALFKLSNARFAPLRHKARGALLLRLDEYGRQRDENALVSFILSQSDLSFKLYAFLCLPEQAIHRPLLKHMASQHYQLISGELIHQMLAKIEAAGWRLQGAARHLPCGCCNGKGGLPCKIACAGQSSVNSSISICTECNENAGGPFFILSCTAPYGRGVEFRLPASVLLKTGA